MLNKIWNHLSASPAFREVFDARADGVSALYEMAEGQRPFYAALLARQTGRQVLYVAPTESAAMRAADDCAVWLSGGAAVLPPPDVHFTRGTASRENAFQRLAVLQRVRRGDVRVLCACADALQTRMLPPGAYEKNAVQLTGDSRIEPADLIARLVQMGYERVDMVEGKGQCALRGAIVDAFSPAENSAARIEFWDDQVDSIRAFDPISQRSLDQWNEAVFYPAVEWLMDAENGKKIRALVRDQMARLPDSLLSSALPPLPEDEGETPQMESAADAAPRVYASGIARLMQDADQLEAGLQPPSLHLWAGALNIESAFLWEYMREPILVIEEPDRIKSRCEDRSAGFQEDFKLALERQEAVPEQGALLYSWEDILSAAAGLPVHLVQDLLRGMGGFSPRRIARFAGINAPKYVSRFKDLAGDLQNWNREGYLTLLLAGGEARARRLSSALAQLDAPTPLWDETGEGNRETENRAVIWPQPLSHGFLLPEYKLCVVADSDMFGTGYRKTHRRQNAGERIEAFTDLKEGDYVVHEAHGVGIFRGTVRLQSEGTYRDYLLIQYQGSDKLYVPTDQFDRVQKFIGGQDSPPPLNSLSGNDWEKKKNKVKAGLKKLAFDLVRLYAERQAVPGHAFAPDTPWQREFEDAFPYELTPDQDKAVTDIKADMERPGNMDRLICGDVGYGKTEVALRAAMKAVMDGKQVALLAPTTILAQQHYYTMLKRFADFPVHIDVLSRFRSPKLQKETLAKLKEGKVDILVGTHRLLSKDVTFRDLGLLIVDEEQRFGVAHKESIKNLKKTVDVLTLSATPIPRTLHMSMVGVRDMSLLETPPEERYPVQTYVLDYNDAVIRDAILREMNREGQVYFLYNRVQSIDAFAARLRALVPEARIAVAHGQMRESLLEDVMLDFYEGKFDVLLCSAIIENGLDVPRANTIIIFDADRFGLSQLYQLRGRVGRSTRVAYAYFTVRPDKMLSETAEKRLSAIREFTAFGSGFRIAMRDLEIRGAGNIFGPEQSGQVAQVGYDMYCRLIEEAVQEARGLSGDQGPFRVETRVELRVDAYLPVEYVRGETQRMEVFKRISLIKNREDREDVIEEMIDRFGDIPESVMNLIDIAHLRGICGRLGISRVSYTAGTLVFRLVPSAIQEPAALYAALEKTDKRLLLSAAREPALLFRDPKLTVEELLRAAVPLLEKVEKAEGEIKGRPALGESSSSQ